MRWKAGPAIKLLEFIHKKGKLRSRVPTIDIQHKVLWRILFCTNLMCALSYHWTVASYVPSSVNNDHIWTKNLWLARIFYPNRTWPLTEQILLTFGTKESLSKLTQAIMTLCSVQHIQHLFLRVFEMQKFVISTLRQPQPNRPLANLQFSKLANEN